MGVQRGAVVARDSQPPEEAAPAARGGEMNQAQVEELVYQALETELGGVEVYSTAVQCARNEDLKEEWEEYLEQTRRHVQVMRTVCDGLGLDPEKETPGRRIVRSKGQALVASMKAALEHDGDAAELVACECVVDAETKDHQNWELMRLCSEKLAGEEAKVLADACDEVEDEEDEHLYHTMGWCRELWIQSLGLPAQLPPPEEEKDVKTAIGAARAKQARRPARTR
jgi:rubrerythrin